MQADKLLALQARLEAVVRGGWLERDPDAEVRSRLRDGNKIDMTVISVQFAGLDGRDREALFWPVFDPVPRYDLLHMTYCLLMTPEEAARMFASEAAERALGGEGAAIEDVDESAAPW